MSLNCWTLTGRLTRDPELKYVGQGGGTALCKFGIAVDGHKKDEVHFFDCVAWTKAAQNIDKFFSKGDPIGLVGEGRVESWEKDGQKRSKVVFNVGTWSFCGPTKQAEPGEPDEVSRDDGFEKIPF